MRGVWVWLILAWFVAGGAQAAQRPVPLAADFAADAQQLRERRVPMLVMFDSPGCSYCRQVREEFLVPLTRNEVYRERMVMREVNTKSNARIIGFDGKPTTMRKFAKSHSVKLVPSVMLVDADGKEITPRLVGLSTPDFYGAYLEATIDTAFNRMRSDAPAAQ